MPQDLYQYEKMIDRALRGVVREALERAGRDGLRGAHHFYICFATDMPGVSIPESLRERYPHEMTIVLQHQFWDLEVGKNKFAVTLSFQSQPERLVIPFAAVRSFTDPSVNFALEFASPERPEAAPSVPAPPPTVVPAPIAPPAKPAETATGKAEEKPEKTGAEVVALDSFRKR
ncbi:MAG: SspB family protein [Alphaproteobacteria bacterium]